MSKIILCKKVVTKIVSNGIPEFVVTKSKISPLYNLPIYKIQLNDDCYHISVFELDI